MVICWRIGGSVMGIMDTMGFTVTLFNAPKPFNYPSITVLPEKKNTDQQY